jgi:hypothetical protein
MIFVQSLFNILKMARLTAITAKEYIAIKSSLSARNTKYTTNKSTALEALYLLIEQNVTPTLHTSYGGIYNKKAS